MLKNCHASEGWHPVLGFKKIKLEDLITWMPAFAGMTVVRWAEQNNN